MVYRNKRSKRKIKKTMKRSNKMSGGSRKRKNLKKKTKNKKQNGGGGLLKECIGYLCPNDGDNEMKEHMNPRNWSTTNTHDNTELGKWLHFYNPKPSTREYPNNCAAYKDAMEAWTSANVALKWVRGGPAFRTRKGPLIEKIKKFNPGLYYLIMEEYDSQDMKRD